MTYPKGVNPKDCRVRPPEGPRFKSWPSYHIKLKGLRHAVAPFLIGSPLAIFPGDPGAGRAPISEKRIFPG
jgi:hypothetical protein